MEAKAGQAGEHSGGGESGLGVVLAAVGGSLSATGANVMSWSEHRVRVTGRAWSTRQSLLFVVACTALNLLGIAIFAASCALGGAVATVMPVQTGFQLVANMIWQMALGIKHYTKSMRVGTLILLLSVAELGGLGPQEPSDLDILHMLQQPGAMTWVAALVLGTVAALAASYLTLDQPRESLPKLCSLTLVVSLTTVIGSSISKCFGLLKGGALMACVGLYFLDGLLCMGFTVIANKSLDVSIFVPLQLSSQLVINMFTGLLVWGDWKYIDRPFEFLVVYVVSIMAVYLISPELDVFGQLLRRRRLATSKLSSGVAGSRLGIAALELLTMWQQVAGTRSVEDPVQREACAGRLEEDPVQREACAGRLEEALIAAVETEALTSRELVSLVMRMAAERGPGPSGAIVRWLEEDVAHYRLYMERDPEFAIYVRGSLTAEEQRMLPILSCRGSTRACMDDAPSRRVVAPQGTGATPLF